MTELQDPAATIETYRRGLRAVLDDLSPDEIAGLIGLLAAARDGGHCVFIVGNGGSASTASHLACDLAKTVLGRHLDPGATRFKVIALTDNMPLITAYGNDVGFESVFAQPLRNLAEPGDVLIVISASGNSPNIVAALKAARELGLRTGALLGFAGGQAAEFADCAVIVRSDHYGYIEDAHMVLCHLLTEHFKTGVSRA
ncbi:MAG TPA: SIS domain-containing protein [Chloroflexota bacterium]|nr:SIS domain-containing protein [Chloroflexota bacterium]